VVLGIEEEGVYCAVEVLEGVHCLLLSLRIVTRNGAGCGINYASATA
jgi:hypothetical protein